jgi:phage-related holin
MGSTNLQRGDNHMAFYKLSLGYITRIAVFLKVIMLTLIDQFMLLNTTFASCLLHLYVIPLFA